MTGQGTERRHRREHDDAVFRRDLHVATPKPKGVSRQVERRMAMMADKRPIKMSGRFVAPAPKINRHILETVADYLIGVERRYHATKGYRWGRA